MNKQKAKGIGKISGGILSLVYIIAAIVVAFFNADVSVAMIVVPLCIGAVLVATGAVGYMLCSIIADGLDDIRRRR